MPSNTNKPVAKRRLSNIDFSHEGAHLAVVGDFQGGPANMQTTLVYKATADISEELIQKATQVQVTMDFEDFLCKFFNMYYSDAEVLAKVLGFDDDADEATEDASFQSYVDAQASKIQILKQCYESDNPELVLAQQSPLDIVHIRETQQWLEKALIKIEKSGKVLKVVKQAAPIKPKVNQGASTVETIEKAQHEVILAAELQKAADLAKANLDAVEVELQKAREQISAIEADKQAIKKAQRLEKLKTVANAKEAEDLEKSTESLTDEAFDKVFKSLSTAAKALHTSDLFKAVGQDGGAPSDTSNGTAAILKSKYKK